MDSNNIYTIWNTRYSMPIKCHYTRNYSVLCEGFTSDHHLSPPTSRKTSVQHYLYIVCIWSRGIILRWSVTMRCTQHSYKVQNSLAADSWYIQVNAPTKPGWLVSIVVRCIAVMYGVVFLRCTGHGCVDGHTLDRVLWDGLSMSMGVIVTAWGVRVHKDEVDAPYPNRLV